MKILNLGSLNIDKVYAVGHFAAAGETIKAERLDLFPGGKGLNQSIAAARAGAEVYHAGAVGRDGGGLSELLRGSGVNVGLLRQLDGESGHAVIQVTPSGQNCIIVFPGTNGMITHGYIDSVLKNFAKGDVLLLQNEISCVDYAMEKGSEMGMRVVVNPSPVTDALLNCPLGLADCFILNETEGMALAGTGSSANADILRALAKRFPAADIVLTVGKDGALYSGRDGTFLSHGIYDTDVKDTTAAGDTFCGYYIACTAAGESPREALEKASAASSIAVSRKGASPSIPVMREVMSLIGKNAG
ncbi:MAG TPA: ribokinase [Ruminococcaceae bacterium]|nr:ribokinase [Oscillospiraceae bacterium]